MRRHTTTHGSEPKIRVLADCSRGRHMWPHIAAQHGTDIWLDDGLQLSPDDAEREMSEQLQADREYADAARAIDTLPLADVQQLERLLRARLAREADHGPLPF